MMFLTSRKKRWTLFWHSLVSAFFASALVAEAAAPGKYITSDDFDLVKEMFSHRECGIPKFFEISKALGLASTWRQFDDDPSTAENPLANLSDESLCLLSLSSSFEAYQVRREQDGFYRSKKVGRENIFPTSVRVDRLIFFLPKFAATQKCTTFEGPTVPYVIII